MLRNMEKKYWTSFGSSKVISFRFAQNNYEHIQSTKRHFWRNKPWKMHKPLIFEHHMIFTIVIFLMCKCHETELLAHMHVLCNKKIVLFGSTTFHSTKFTMTKLVAPFTKTFNNHLVTSDGRKKKADTNIDRRNLLAIKMMDGIQKRKDGF